MARLDTRDGKWIELTPVRYQFPGITWNEDDANWLYVDFEADLPDFRVRRRTAPSFQTWDLTGFVSDGLRLGDAVSEAVLAGVEPGLRIEVRALSAERSEVRLALALEFAPLQREPFDEPFLSVLHADKFELKRFFQDLQRELVPFPQRTV